LVAEPDGRIFRIVGVDAYMFTDFPGSPPVVERYLNLSFAAWGDFLPGEKDSGTA
jgi:hypothetical protein